jgi:hypothetical protein
LGETTFEQVYSRGQAMNFETAISYALSTS